MDHITDQDNVLATRTLEGRLTVTFQNGSSIRVGGISRFERLTQPFQIRFGQFIGVGDYSFNEINWFLSSDQSQMFGGKFSGSKGDFFDGDKNSYSLTGHFQTAHFRTEVSWSQDKVNLPSGDFDTDLVTSRVNYSFNPTMFLDALIQYNSDLKEIASNIRFNFIHKPLSDFFLVYNERRSSTGDVLDRALVAKLTYVFSF